MLETFRSIGYSLDVAVADIVDNSITAGAANVWINFTWDGAESWATITDDGRGMDGASLIEALRPGSRHPLDERDPKDLGRFGLGLKTASFSQCRRLTVISRQEAYAPVHWSWDFDYVSKSGRWDLIQMPLTPELAAQAQALDHGTIVVWQQLDRLVADTHADNQKDHSHFLDACATVKHHLAMVFHRFIEKRRVRLFFNNHEIPAWDPFLKGASGGQVFEEERYQNGLIAAKGYVLPHKSRFESAVDYNAAQGPRGWNEQQGFYIYRNERMLVSGSWLGLFRKEEHSKLARIMVDIPNHLDAEWKIDIKKSVARPPAASLSQLRNFARRVRAEAVEVFRHKGKVLNHTPGVSFQELWQEKYFHDKRHFQINRDHTLIQNFIEQHPESQQMLNTLLKFVEETIPVSLIMIRESESPEQQAQPFEGVSDEPVIKTMKAMFSSLRRRGNSAEAARAIISNIQPFNQFPQYLAALED